MCAIRVTTRESNIAVSDVPMFSAVTNNTINCFGEQTEQGKRQLIYQQNVKYSL